MSQWQFGRTTSYLQYKLAAEGISLQKVDEAYTTQTCPVCGRKVVDAMRESPVESHAVMPIGISCRLYRNDVLTPIG